VVFFIVAYSRNSTTVCNLKEGWLPGAEVFERGSEEVVGEIRKLHTGMNNYLTPHQILLEWSNQGQLCEVYSKVTGIRQHS